MNIGELSHQTGVPAKTIRHYEAEGLLRPARAPNGYRQFSEDDRRRLQFVVRARALGFGLADCAELLELFDDQSRQSRDVKAIAARHLARVDDDLAALQRMREQLLLLVTACAGDQGAACPILDDLAAGSTKLPVDRLFRLTPQ